VVKEFSKGTNIANKAERIQPGGGLMIKKGERGGSMGTMGALILDGGTRGVLQFTTDRPLTGA